MNGLAANSILLACAIAATNIEALRSFLRAADPGPDGTYIRRYSTWRVASVKAADIPGTDNGRRSSARAGARN